MKLKHLSASTLESYEICPRRLWKRKVDDPRQSATIFTEIGRAVHRTLEIYHTEGLGEHENLATLLDTVAKEFSPLDFGRFSDMRSLLAQYQEENPLPSPTIAVEKEFSFRIGEFEVVGYIDRIDYHGDGVYEIVDYKTSFIKKEAEELRHDLQGIIYDIALRFMWEQGVFAGLPEPVRVIFSLYFIRYGKVSAEYDDEDRENAKAFIEYTAYRIEMDDEEPEARINSYCRTCEYRGDCPLFTGDWQKYIDSEIYEDLDTLITALEKYKHVKKILDTKISDIQQQIIVELEDQGVNHYVNNTGVSARIQSQSRSAYDIEGIKQSLPNWAKYGTVDVKYLLEEGSPEEVAVVNHYKRINKTRPFINTKQTKF